MTMTDPITTTTGHSTDSVVSLDTGQIVTTSVLDGSAGQLPVLLEEFEAIGAIVAADPRWVSALEARRASVDSVVCVPLSAGYYDYPQEEGRRILRVLAFRQDYSDDHPWAHPVDGLCAYVDVSSRTITRLIDAEVMPIPAEGGNVDDPAVQGAPLTALKPISITQPEGPSFDGVEQRPIMYRGSIAEMVVLYGDPSPVRFWQNYFDTGEYLFGRFTNLLALGCDCVGEIKYFDAVLADEVGTLWKHSDMFTGSNEVRRSRHLVISFFTTMGNYDYGFYWYRYLDGSIECEAKLTGILFTSSYVPGSPHASEVAPGLGAPYHQHHFSARLDMMVDGLSNAVDEVDAVRLPISDENHHGGAFTNSATRLSSEADAGRLADASVGRAWHIVNTEKTDRLGRPTGYVLMPQQSPTLMADPASSIAARCLHHQAAQGDPVRPGGGLPGRGLRAPEPRERRPATLHGRRPVAGWRGHHALAHLRADALSAPGGLAGDADRLRQVHAQALRILRQHPCAERAAERVGTRMLARWRWPCGPRRSPPLDE
jgi:primary-amine oxidase